MNNSSSIGRRAVTTRVVSSIVGSNGRASPRKQSRTPMISRTTYLVIVFLASVVGINIYLISHVRQEQQQQQNQQQHHDGHVSSKLLASSSSTKISELSKMRKTGHSKKLIGSSSHQSSQTRRNSKEGSSGMIRTKTSTAAVSTAGAPSAGDSSNTKAFHEDNNLALCLLTKDDVDILPEWIAYHYHTLRLRHLIVAVDPSSKTYPTSVLDTFRKYLPNLVIEEWHDENYLPTYFTKHQNYTLVPNFMGRSIQHMTFGEWCIKEKVRPLIVRDMTIINNHRFRQVKFVTQCMHRLLSIRQQGQQQDPIELPVTRFVSPLDSDEYIVMNPRILSKLLMPTNSSRGGVPTSTLEKHQAESWRTVESGSVMDFLVDRLDHHHSRNASNSDDNDKFHDYIYYKQKPTGINDMQGKKNHASSENVYDGDGSCIPVPRLLFGSVEDKDGQNQDGNKNNERSSTSTQFFNSSKFETLRWKYHAPYLNEYNYIQKVVIDLSKLPVSPTTIPADTSSKRGGRDGEYDLPTLLNWLANPEGGSYSDGSTQGKDTNILSSQYKDFAYSVHQPSYLHCPPETKDGLDHPIFGATTPLSINHYLGSWERYDTRDDKRRSERVRKSICFLVARPCF